MRSAPSVASTRARTRPAVAVPSGQLPSAAGSALLAPGPGEDSGAGQGTTSATRPSVTPRLTIVPDRSRSSPARSAGSTVASDQLSSMVIPTSSSEPAAAAGFLLSLRAARDGIPIRNTISNKRNSRLPLRMSPATPFRSHRIHRLDPLTSIHAGSTRPEIPSDTPAQARRTRHEPERRVDTESDIVQTGGSLQPKTGESRKVDLSWHPTPPNGIDPDLASP